MLGGMGRKVQKTDLEQDDGFTPEISVGDFDGVFI